VETAVKRFGAVEAEEVAVTVGTATLGSADGLVRVFAGWRQKNQAPARHNRHNNIQIHKRLRIALSQLMIISLKKSAKYN
jgi:hypothetical protein